MKPSHKWKDFFGFEEEDRGERYPKGYTPPVTDLDSYLPDPHYSNPYFETARLIYGEEKKVEEEAYSDRLAEWDWDKSNKAHDKAMEKKRRNTAGFWQEYLSIYYGRPVELVYILGGFNLANGFPYFYFGWNYKDK